MTTVARVKNKSRSVYKRAQHGDSNSAVDGILIFRPRVVKNQGGAEGGEGVQGVQGRLHQNNKKYTKIRYYFNVQNMYEVSHNGEVPLDLTELNSRQRIHLWSERILI